MIPDLQAAMWDVVHLSQRQPGTAVIYDMDHTDGVYAAAEHLHGIFERMVIITPRDGVAEDMWLVARQGTIRRLYHKQIKVVRSSEPVWSEAFEQGALEYRNAYTGATGTIPDVAFLSYATPRAPRDELAAPLRTVGIAVHLAGDCRSPQDLLFATREAHAAGLAV